MSQMQLRELFRLADPDHSKTIDLVEFRAFLSDLPSLETEPERFLRGLQLRTERSFRQVEQDRSKRMKATGLLARCSSVDAAARDQKRSHRGGGFAQVMPLDDGPEPPTNV